MAWNSVGNIKGPPGQDGASGPGGALKYREVEFLASGTFTPPQELLDGGGEAHVLLVGGGGGGGYGVVGGTTGECGGGGGGGEVLQAVYKFTGATTITVGAGGSGATVNTAQGTDGGDTSIGALLAQGGGGGGSSVSTGAARDGRSKGTGGGTGTNYNGTANCGGGGGGGAGGHGESALLGAIDSGLPYYGVIGRGRNGGDGGAGIVATNVRSGGAGGMGVLGFGGGGAGGGGSNVTGWYFEANGSDGGGDSPGGDAVANSGGGGAGGGNRGAKATGGNGGSGRVKIWWYEGARGTKGDPGATGPANTLSIGTVTGGGSASATITGTAPAQTLNLVLPKGDKGDKGDPGAPGTTSWAGITDKPLVREALTASRTYYVRTDGDNNNTGLENTTAGAFRSIQRAYDVAKMLDTRGFNVTISVAAGNHLVGFVVDAPLVGGGLLTISGAGAGLTVLTLPNGNPVKVLGPGARAHVSGMSIASATNSLRAEDGALLTFSGMEFRATYGNAGNHIFAANRATVRCTGSYQVSGGANTHFLADGGALIDVRHASTTIGTNPTFVVAWAYAQTGGLILGYGYSGSGATTATRYLATHGGGISVQGQGANIFPGSAAGSVNTGGWYF